jgi:N-acetyl-gamma-glutamyl-phosphate reductase
MEISLLTANSHAGKPLKAVYPHFSSLKLPDLVTVEEADWSTVDAVFCGLPHGTTQDIISQIVKSSPKTKIIDMSADFRLRNVDTYAKWYGGTHRAQDLQKQAVYGLTEQYRDDVAKARLVACPGCYPTAALTALIPLMGQGLVDETDIIIDAKSGVSGAGRSPKEATLFCEAGESKAPYGIANHRHAPEIEQELGARSGKEMIVNFTPHLVPMSRGEFLTIYVKLEVGKTAQDLRSILQVRYENETFVHLLDEGVMPSTSQVRGSNHVHLNVFADRVPNRAIVLSTLDNLVKGSAGQAVQNFNLMFGLPENTGLMQLPMFP